MESLISTETARTAMTVGSFIIFLCICFWAYSSKRKNQFEEAANLPFDDDDIHKRTIDTEQKPEEQMTSKKGEITNG